MVLGEGVAAERLLKLNLGDVVEKDLVVFALLVLLRPRRRRPLDSMECLEETYPGRIS